MVALIGLAIFSQYWYWHPLIHFISLAFTPTSIIGLNHNLKMPAFTFKSNARPSLFAYPPETKPPTVLVPTKVSTAILSTTRKAKARVPSKKGGLESSSLGASSLGTSDQMEIDVSKPKNEQDKANDDKEKKSDESKDEKVVEKKLKECFDLHDRKGNKWLPSAELGNALRAVGKKLTQDQIKQLATKADKELGGQIGFDAFKSFVGLATEVEKNEKDIEYAFNIFSRGDPRGVVEMDTFKHFLTTLGDKLTKKQVDAFLADAGIKGGTIDLETFMKAINANTL